ncbi:MAG: RidA family protein [Gammaproteobacteria bacterium]|nr:MAG: RidA family protein [Gammaproteobacteria bacterium]UTW42966.1 RidA family protein [bacterium SCSIO 12844]
MKNSKEIINTDQVNNYQHYGFSQAVVQGDYVFVTGQAGLDANGNLVGHSMKEQAYKTFENMGIILKEASLSLEHIVYMTCYIVSLSKHGPDFWQVRKEVMPNSHYTSTSIGISELVQEGLLLEIQAIAHR